MNGEDYGPNWLWAELAMCRNDYGAKAEMTFHWSGMKPKVRARAAELRVQARNFFKIKIWSIFFTSTNV